MMMMMFIWSNFVFMFIHLNVTPKALGDRWVLILEGFGYGHTARSVLPAIFAAAMPVMVMKMILTRSIRFVDILCVDIFIRRINIGS